MIKNKQTFRLQIKKLEKTYHPSWIEWHQMQVCTVGMQYQSEIQYNSRLNIRDYF